MPVCLHLYSEATNVICCIRHSGGFTPWITRCQKGGVCEASIKGQIEVAEAVKKYAKCLQSLVHFFSRTDLFIIPICLLYLTTLLFKDSTPSSSLYPHRSSSLCQEVRQLFLCVVQISYFLTSSFPPFPSLVSLSIVLWCELGHLLATDTHLQTSHLSGELGCRHYWQNLDRALFWLVISSKHGALV